jgi:coenzyme F420-reducing hydrogenase alpha subunit
MAETRTIAVDYLARVEGEGSLLIRMKDGVAEEVKLAIFEPPRFFEGFLRGRAATEAPDITSRICGICPVAYMMSACHAVEDAFGVTLPDTLGRLRRLLYCGEWIESHALHVFMLHAPDFVGCADVVEMARHHKPWVEKGLAIKKAGNAIVRVLGGREIHPINVCVGGFYRAPEARELAALLPALATAQVDAEASLRWLASFDFPDFERDYELVALRHPRDYPFCEGRIVSSRGLDIAVSEYDDHFEERHVAHSTALHSTRKPSGTAYFVGPLARVSLNFDRLGDAARAAAAAIGFQVPCHNPFKSLLARGIELVQALDEAQRIIAGYVRPAEARVAVTPVAGTGYGCTEAPRGSLYHRYRIDGAGLIEAAQIVPPTSQNQITIEDDLRALAPTLASMPLPDATWRAEQAVRNYDPCISCSTHFLKLRIEGA